MKRAERSSFSLDRVIAYVRDLAKLGDLAARVQIVKGELTDAAAIEAAVRGSAAVISAIGSSPDRAQLDVPADGMRLVLGAMERSGVRRIVVLSGAAVVVPRERKPIGGRIASWFVRLMARNVVEAKQREYAVVRGSDRDGGSSARRRGGRVSEAVTAQTSQVIGGYGRSSSDGSSRTVRSIRLAVRARTSWLTPGVSTSSEPAGMEYSRSAVVI